MVCRSNLVVLECVPKRRRAQAARGDAAERIVLQTAPPRRTPRDSGRVAANTGAPVKPGFDRLGEPSNAINSIAARAYLSRASAKGGGKSQ